MSSSARRAGIRLAMNSETVPMVPAIIKSTLKSTACMASIGENDHAPAAPSSKNTAAPPSAVKGRYCGRASIKR